MPPPTPPAAPLQTRPVLMMSPLPSSTQMMTVPDMKDLLKKLFPSRHQAVVKHVLSLIWSSETNDMTQKEV
ncbi:hypothetical protein ANCDUO_13459 [Ancylostoma duodenale]|uniref:Uncharacterized protein n=1 Tax=Ancylostoma duodenale TaxID=51022 RepID=A0A0C2G5W1_9BILA|nr:hypothetical protein ANCDUO_13459 [Ancylostoma duodenale]